MIKAFLSIFIYLTCSLANAQSVVPWEILAIPYSTTPDGLFEPNFPNWLDKYKNQEVVVQGYLVPIDVGAKQYALSKTAFASCFFCGQAEPNTVIELQFKEKPDNFVTDQWVILKGILTFNESDPYRLFFVLKNTELQG
jgi:hypothetical protein